MIEAFSNRIADWLIKTGVIKAELRALYSYATFNLLHTSIPLIITIWIGFLMGSPIEGLFLILPFVVLRKYCGGFHMSTPFRCVLASVFLLTSFLTLVKTTELSFVLLIVFLVAELLLSLFSPVDPKSRNLTASEITYCSIHAKQSLVVIDMLCCVLYLVNRTELSCSLMYGVFLCEVLQLPVIIDNKRSKTP